MIKKILKENLFYIILIVLTIVAFVWLSKSMYFDSIINFDNKVIDWFNNIHVNGFTNILKIITNLGDWYLPIAVIVCIFLFLKNKWYFYILSGSYLLSGIISFVSKLLILRPRPVIALINIPKSYSFPSGHTLTSIVFYITLCYIFTLNKNYNKRILLLILKNILIFLIALSRVYLGVHFFSDVIGGFILGIELECLIINIISKNFKEKFVKSIEK